MLKKRSYTAGSEESEVVSIPASATRPVALHKARQFVAPWQPLHFDIIFNRVSESLSVGSLLASERFVLYCGAVAVFVVRNFLANEIRRFQSISCVSK